jgi:hypothetical protein
MSPGSRPREDRPGARAWWQRIEPVNALAYFAPECDDGLRAAGLRGFWMGYFAARAAPLGAVGSDVVMATFFNFHPSMVRRSIPDAWAFAPPPQVLQARRSGAARAMRRILPAADRSAEALVPFLRRVVDAADGSGRALFSANRELGRPDDPVEDLWQACTCLREHRGDGHLAALTSAGLDGCEVLVLFSLSESLPASMFHASRGWSTAEWESARARLEDRGLVRGEQPSPAGLDLRRSIEQSTDDLAGLPFAALSDEECPVVFRRLEQMAAVVMDAGDIRFPNPMGLPPLDTD